MPGFFVGNIEHGVLINEFNDRCIQEQTIIDELFLLGIPSIAFSLISHSTAMMNMPLSSKVFS